MLFSVLPAFFIVVLKAGAASLGLVEGISEGCSNLIKIYSGHLPDKLHRRKIFVVTGYAPFRDDAAALFGCFTRPRHL
jgi:hypothetical protein